MFLHFFLLLHLLLLQPSANYRAEKAMSDKLNFPKHTGIREASLLLVKEKCGRYTLIREPLYLDRCVVCSEADWDDYFEVQEISSKDTFIFKVSSRRQAISNTAIPTFYSPTTSSHLPFILSSCSSSCSRSRFCPFCPFCLLCFCHFQHPVRFVSFQLGLIWFRWVCLGLPGLSLPARLLAVCVCVPVHLAFELERLPFDCTPAMFGLR